METLAQWIGWLFITGAALYVTVAGAVLQVFVAGFTGKSDWYPFALIAFGLAGLGLSYAIAPFSITVN